MMMMMIYGKEGGKGVGVGCGDGGELFAIVLFIFDGQDDDACLLLIFKLPHCSCTLYIYTSVLKLKLTFAHCTVLL